MPLDGHGSDDSRVSPRDGSGQQTPSAEALLPDIPVITLPPRGSAGDDDSTQRRLQARAPRLSARFVGGEWEQPTPAALAREMRLTIYVNELELVSVLCTPQKLNYLALGFLYSEGIISGMEDVVSLRVCVDDALVDIRLRRPFDMPLVRTITSGCGAGVAFGLDPSSLPMVDVTGQFAPEQIVELMRKLEDPQDGRRVRRGTHISALSDGERLMMTAEDVGRHNTLDKIVGECLANRQSTAGLLLLSTGRISWEMLAKAARMQVAVVASRNSPTDRVAALAEELGIGVAGYVKGNSLTVYASDRRFRGCPSFSQ